MIIYNYVSQKHEFIYVWNETYMITAMNSILQKSTESGGTSHCRGKENHNGDGRIKAEDKERERKGEKEKERGIGRTSEIERAGKSKRGTK